jgi:hypothetical protein
VTGSHAVLDERRHDGFCAVSFNPAQSLGASDRELRNASISGERSLE